MATTIDVVTQVKTVGSSKEALVTSADEVCTTIPVLNPSECQVQSSFQFRVSPQVR